MKSTRIQKAVKPSPHPIPDIVALRALSKFALEAPTGCHVSTYSTGSHGYAQITWVLPSGKTAGTTAHRAAWTAIHGAIPPGMTIDHTCKTRRCVNVAHLRMLPNYENARRTLGRDWRLGECINGHPNSESYQQPSGKRICRPCNEAAQLRYRQKKRAA